MPPETLPFPNERRWYCLACCIWGLTLLIVSARILFWSELHNTFLIFAQAGRNWGAGSSLYGFVAPRLDVFRYSPLVAALLAPMALLPIGLASALWVLINAAVFLAGLCSWQRSVASPRVSFVALALVVLPLTIASLFNGQCNALVIGLVLAGVAAVAQERWNKAAAFIALATFLKLYPVVIGLLLVALYPRKLAGRLAIALAAGLLLPFVLQQPAYVFHQYTDWAAYLHGDDRTLLPLYLWMQDFRLLCRVWLEMPSPAVYALIQGFTGLAVAGLCVAAAWRRWPKSELITLLTGLGCTWMVLFGPATEPCTYIMLAPSLGLALVQAWSSAGARWRKALLAGILGLLLAGHVCKWFSITEGFRLLGPQPFAALVFFLLIGGEALFRIGRRPIELSPERLPRAA